MHAFDLRAVASQWWLAADVQVQVVEARDELREKTSAVRQSYDAWRARRNDEKLQRNLFDAELELEEASPSRRSDAIALLSPESSSAPPCFEDGWSDAPDLFDELACR